MQIISPERLKIDEAYRVWHHEVYGPAIYAPPFFEKLPDGQFRWEIREEEFVEELRRRGIDFSVP